jgi:oligosaccharyltransferase complex subunit alpha (ribophorin I)
LTDNLLIFKIHLGSDTKALGVNEFHQNRKEPFPKTIKVYEKQTVEVYESKYYLSVYPT